MKSFLLAAWSLLIRDYRVRFRRTLFGIMWFLAPFFALVAMALLIGNDMSLYPKGQESEYLVQLITGLILWQLMVDAWLEPIRLARRANMILRSVSFDPRVLLGAGALSALAALVIKTPFLVTALVWFKIPFTFSFLWFPVAICGLVTAGMALACFTLPLSLALLDVRYALPFIQYALLLATPIFYMTSKVGLVVWINQINPFTYLVPPFRDVLIGTPPALVEILLPLMLVLALFWLGLRYFQAKISLAVAYIGH